MRLVRLSVQRFQCIEEADVEFGPGLNVLFGPNDLGKSSLAWAIRAVLLLQHSSTHHERFVSWYGEGEPRVALTFTDASNRFWRVTKTFGGSRGRSLLEVSKDGVSFSTDAQNRQVDEKVRQLLGWGLPSAAGGTRTFPDSFLVQVLLSDQDNVRKVLFDTSLDDDQDESGRERLTAALGALAQDPLFKEILDGAQANVDKAFTPKGRRKTAAGSPFVENAEKLKELKRDLEATEARVRETASAETRIRELIATRDKIAQQLGDATREVAAAELALAVAQKRAAIRAEIATRQARVDEASALRAEVPRAEQHVSRLEADVLATERRATELDELLKSHRAEQRAARERLEALAIDHEADRRRETLESELRGERERLQQAKSHIDRSRERERTAKALVNSHADARREADQHAANAATAEATRARLERDLETAGGEVVRAQEALRDLSSDDVAQARALRRAELENQRLAHIADETQITARLAELNEHRAVVERLGAARTAVTKQEHELTTASTTVKRLVSEMDTIDATARLLDQLERYGHFKNATTEVAAARTTVAALEANRVEIERLREVARVTRSRLRSELPSAKEATELRRLADDLRVSRAKLGGGFSITVRPRRELTIASSIDGATPTSKRSKERYELAGNQSATITIDDVVDIDIAAGEEAARREAASLQARWDSAGGPTLSRLGLESLDELDALIAADAAAVRQAEAVERDAAHLQKSVDGTSTPDLAGAEERLASLEQALGDADREALTGQFAKLGAQWQTAVKQRREAQATERKRIADRLESQRAILTRAETQLEGLMATRAALEGEVERSRAALQGDLDQLRASGEADLASVRSALATLTSDLAKLDAAPDETVGAKQAVARAEAARDGVRTKLDKATAEAGRLRDGATEARARLAAVRDRAHEVDPEGRLKRAFEANEEPDLTPWSEATRASERAYPQHETTCKRLESALAEAARAKTESIEKARATGRRIDLLVIETERTLADATGAHRSAQEKLSEQRLAIAELKTKVAQLNVAGLQGEIDKLLADLNALGGDDRVDEALVERLRQRAEAVQIQHDAIAEELAKAKGGLEQVGGAMVHDLKRELTEAMTRELQRERELEVEYEAWRLLVTTMKETETTEGAHLGRALSTPVTQRFRQLTENRYDGLELAPDLRANGLNVAGQLRAFGTLSAGTQDQLATLLRLSVAEQLRSSIVLDDHLSQSDPGRVSWFNSVLRAAAHQIQIVFITCRPAELLTEAEMPRPEQATASTAGGHVRAIDLGRVIRRLGAARRPSNAASTRSDSPTTRPRDDR